MRSTIKSVAVGFPKNTRDNSWFKTHQPETWRKVEENTLAKVFNSDNGNAQTRSFDAAMLGYLRDPFRGTVERRIMEPGQSQIELERRVALQAIDAAGLALEDIDHMLAAAFPTEHTGVGDAAFLAQAMGFRRAAWNIETACSGGLAALQMAGTLVDSGQMEHVLVVVSCVYSRACDWSDTLTWFLGDGVAAYVVSRAKEGEGFLSFSSVSTAATCGAFRYDLEVNDGRARPVIRADAEGARALRDITPAAIRDTCNAALKSAQLDKADIACFVPNTPLAWFADLFSSVLDVDRERVASTYERYANMGPVLNAVNLHHAIQSGMLKPGDNALLFTIGSVSTAVAATLRVGAIAAPPAIEMDD